METIKAIFVIGLLLTVIFGIKFYSQKAIAAVGKKKDCANDKCGCD